LPFHIIAAQNLLWRNYEGTSIPAYGHTDGNGIIFDSFAYVNYSYPALAYGNVVCYNGGGAVQTDGSSNVTIANNSTYSNYLDLENPGTWRGEGNIWGPTSVTNTVVNNVFQNVTSGPGINSGSGSLTNNKSLNYQGGGQTGNVATNNILYPAQALNDSSGQFGGTGFGYPTGQTNSNPLYTALGSLPTASSNTLPCNLRPATGSPAIGKAISAPYIPSGVTNLGAYGPGALQ
jgi:hypothetical protein